MESIIFQTYGLFYGVLSKSEFNADKYTFLAHPKESEPSSSWRYSVRKKLPHSIKEKVDKAPLEGYFLVYPHFKIKEKSQEIGKRKVFDLGFHIYKYSKEKSVSLQHGQFISQGALMSVKPDKFKIGIGINDDPWREYRPYQLLVGGEIDGRVGELWRCLLKLDRYRFDLEKGIKLSNDSPTIRFN